MRTDGFPVSRLWELPEHVKDHDFLPPALSPLTQKSYNGNTSERILTLGKRQALVVF